MAVSKIPYTGKTVRLDTPITERIAPALVTFERSLLSARVAGLLLVIGGAGLGWVARGAFLPMGYQQLAWLVPLVTLLVAWGNRHGET